MKRSLGLFRTRLLQLLRGRFRRAYEDILECMTPYVAVIRSGCVFYLPPRQRAHGLSRELIISLTSYRPRFGTLAHTLRCLVSQTVKPDRVILWISQEDAPFLPKSVTKLQRYGVDIRTTEDIGSYKKIIPALLAFPDAIIVTADDDIFYEADWLEALVSGWNGEPKQIVCHRAHKITLNDNGLPRPYNEWILNVRESRVSTSLFPTAGRGALFPPGSLAHNVTDHNLFLRLCPNADDLWLYWMSRKAGATFKPVAPPRPCVTWPGSQTIGLYTHNMFAGGNDEKIRNLVVEFGFPNLDS